MTFDREFAAIAADAARRENNRELPYDHVDALRRAGFTALTVPAEFGGGGLPLDLFFALLIELGAADSNVPQLLRSHFIAVEQLLLSPPRPERTRWLRAIADGAIFGNAFHERSSAVVGQFVTRISPVGDDWLLNGVKYYSTGTLYADWIAVTASDDSGDRYEVIVDARAEGVDRIDDWNGFGQRLTGSGTTTFVDVRVPAAHVRPLIPGPRTHIGAFVELVLQAAAAGIGQAVLRDAVDFVRTRTRVYSQGSGTLARHDPQVQQVIGNISALAYAASSNVLRAASTLSRAREGLLAGTSEPESLHTAWEQTLQTQLASPDAVLRAASELFEVGGASATDQDRRLDRHWRNARTLFSHNPSMYRARQLGDYLLNDVPLPEGWSTGEHAAGAAAVGVGGNA